MEKLNRLPSVDRVLKEDGIALLISTFGRELVVDSIRDVLGQYRQSNLEAKDNNQEPIIPDFPELMNSISRKIESVLLPTLVPVINATGVILHTNLGRALLCKSAIEALQRVSYCYSNLEFNLEKGRRGSRSIHTEQLLIRLCGTEAAFVVNNNAAAILLVLTALARRRRVIISRTQLIEIGGGFRLPSVLNQSGARLVEIGTTNRVHLQDYEDALQQPTEMILHAHQSNFKIVGFTEEPTLGELAKLTHNYGIYLVNDLGSGSLLDTSRFGLIHEPTVQDAILAGADLVCFSGDKLLGGPQAGIIVGKRELISKIKKHQLARAVRADKLCLAALSATLMCYIKGKAEHEIPVWRMIAATSTEIEKRSQQWKSSIGRGEVIDDVSTIGGGSLPGETLPTSVLALKVDHPTKFLARLRACQFPIIARVANGRVLFDPRTVLIEQEDVLIDELKTML